MPDAYALLDALFAHAPVGLAFWDDELRYRRINPALAAMNGMAPEDHLGRTVDDVLGPELGSTVRELLERVQRTGEPIIDQALEGERAGVDDGPRRWMASYYPVRGADGERLGVAGLVRDVSEEAEAEAERIRLLREALSSRAQAEAAQVRAEAAQAEAEAARRRTAFLAAAGARLVAVSTDYEATLREVARVAVPAIADWCTFTLAGPGDTLDSVAVAAADPELERIAMRMLERYPARADAPTGAALTIRTGESQLVRELPDSLLEAAAQDEEHLALLRRMGLRSGLVVPLRAGGRVLGALTLIAAESGRVYGEDDLRLAEILASRAALAVENARLYEERSHIARTLQRSLLPPALPEIEGLELAARYRAAGDQNEVGGDFYDVFRGRGDVWTLLIGDVAGKGPEAAAVTSLTRHTLRAMTLRDAGAVECLELLNEALLNEESVAGRFCTVLYARACPADDGTVSMTMATGGHLPPRVLRADGTLAQIDLRGSIVGGLRTPVFTECDALLGPGDTLVLFTDGVTELRGHVPGEGERLLDELLVANSGRTPAEIAEAIEANVVELQSGEPRDDVAVLVARPRRA